MAKSKGISKDIQTKYYYYEDHFYMGYKRLFTASHWVCDVTGEEVKLTHNFKAVYTHKMDQYTAFTKRGQPYHESHQRVADRIGMSLKTVEEVAIPLLKRMGLIKIVSESTRKHTTTMYALKHMNGYLINKKLTKETKISDYGKGKQDKLTYADIKRIEHNKRQLDKVKKSKDKVFVLTEEEVRRLRGDKEE